MRRRYVPVLFLALVILLASSLAAQDMGSKRGIFAVFLASQGPVDTALSVSNVLAAPLGIGDEMQARFSVTEGTLEFYLWDSNGSLVVYETGPDSPGAGLSSTGTLSAGQTYRVLLSEVLSAAEYEKDSFVGYGWVIANFEGVQGTTNVTDFARFTQSTVMQPDLGTSFFDLDANAGVPLGPPGNQTQ